MRACVAVRIASCSVFAPRRSEGVTGARMQRLRMPHHVPRRRHTLPPTPSRSTCQAHRQQGVLKRRTQALPCCCPQRRPHLRAMSGRTVNSCRPLPTQPTGTGRTRFQPQRSSTRTRAMCTLPQHRDSSTPTRRLERALDSHTRLTRGTSTGRLEGNHPNPTKGWGGGQPA